WAQYAYGAIHSSPAVAPDGTIYFGSGDGRLYALNPDGTVKWTFTTSTTIESSPTIAPDGTIYISNDTPNLYAVNQDGSQNWMFHPCSPGLFGGCGSLATNGAPAIGADGTVYFSAGALFAVHPADGSQAWLTTLDTNATAAGAPIVGSDGTIYVGSTSQW